MQQNGSTFKFQYDKVILLTGISTFAIRWMQFQISRLLPRPSAQTKLLSRPFCPRQNRNCPGHNFCPWLKGRFLVYKVIQNDFSWLKNSYLPRNSYFESILTEKTVVFTFLSMTISILSWTKPPGQKFCQGRRSRHKVTNLAGA